MLIKINSRYELLSLISVCYFCYLIYSMDLFLICGSLFSAFIHIVIKEITFGWYPPIFKRPDGATNCGLFNTGGLLDHKSGFPSGHVTVISFIMNSFLLTKAPNMYNICLYNIPVLLVAYARVMGGCHNIIQVIAGYILGITIAYILDKYKTSIYKFVDKIKKYAQ
jgi:membrane-associated phospholipid phosphatase